MNTPDNLISVPELRRLLYTIVDNRLNTCFRYRALGEMWQPNFLRVMEINEKGLLLNDEVGNSFKCLPDLSKVMQFEIDVWVHNFLPHNHYDVEYSEKASCGVVQDAKKHA